MNEPDIRELTDFEHARLRTENYLGSRDPHTQMVLTYDGAPVATETTWIPAIFTAIREIIDNALDEVVGFGKGDRIDIEFDPATLVVVVQDNGRGIPIDADDQGRCKATLALSKPRAGRNFGERGTLRGLNGIGASAVNFCSEYFTVDIWRDGSHFSQRFCEGRELIIEAPTIVPLARKAKRRGTRIEFRLSRAVFKTLVLPESFMRARAFETALCYPKLKVFYNRQRVIAAPPFTGPSVIPIVIAEGQFSSKFWLVPNFAEASEQVHCLVNGIPCFDGGAHVDAFRRSFFTGLLTALERESKRRKLRPNRGDIGDGLLIYNITEIEAPTFTSQAKTRLSNAESGDCIKRALDDAELFKTLIKKHDAWIDGIYQRCADRTSKRDASDAGRMARQNLRSKIPEFEDACGLTRRKCILFLGEGKSAIAGMVQARNAELHGGLPLRGKVLNVYGKPIKKVLENAALANVMAVIGLVPNQRVNRHSLRYGKVYIATDADEDGKNIACLLINFFYTFWPDLFDPQCEPYIHVFDTPLVIAAKGKKRRYWYNDDYDDFKAEDHKGWEITRAKGLAALKLLDWKHALEHPRVHAIVEDGRLREALALIFGQDVGAADRRKAWIGL